MPVRRYTILLTPEPDGSAYTVTVPVLPGCITFGYSRDEALANAREAIICHLKGLAACGDPIPEEAAPPELAVVEVEAVGVG